MSHPGSTNNHRGYAFLVHGGMGELKSGLPKIKKLKKIIWMPGGCAKLQNNALLKQKYAINY